jgi:tetratricopeptide (TPR) repeat protein
MRPEDEVTRDHLESVYERAERWSDLAGSLEERILARPPGAPPDGFVLRQLAGIYETKLGQPREAAAILERLDNIGEAEPEELEHLVALHERFGRWSAAATALTRLAEKTHGTARATAARRRVAEIYERELELPDRAIEAYRSFLEAEPGDPDAYAALHSLLDVQGRWSELAVVLEHRAQYADTPARRAQLLHRRARLLADELGQPGEAIPVMLEALAIGPAVRLTRDLVSLLRESGKTQEALDLLETETARVRELQADPRELVPYLLELARLRVEAFQDPEGARRALNEVLASFPDHIVALRELAALDPKPD